MFDYIRSNSDRYVEALRELIRIPSVTSDVGACHAAADFLAQQARQAGLQPRLDTDVTPAPIVFVRVAPEKRLPALVGYAHYDVKPAGDEREWRHDPWSGAVEAGRRFGRGVVDNKSGCLAFVFSAEACLKTVGVPVDLRLVMEGEEEAGSAHLENWALTHAGDVEGAHGLFCLDGSVNEVSQLPRVDLFGRGILYVELSVQTADADVHSSRSMLPHNAAWRLSQALHTIKDVSTDRVIIPGWADELMEVTENDWDYFRERMAHFDWEAIRRQYGLRLEGYPGGRSGLDLIRAYCIEPSCTICGFWSGNIEPGVMMTIVPCRASAKLDFRCPPNLQPEVQLQKLRRHLDSAGFSDVEIRTLSARGHTWHTNHRAVVVRAIKQAGLDVFGQARVQPNGLPTQEGVFYELIQTFAARTWRRLIIAKAIW
ncbi:MAG: M20/M25/M40 family metallo-hydrolase [Verrucomicrobia bacterium]|nr:M20/M25/M40 family metallo-hydrolase [Verrucomicrobiota bacterium]